MRLLKYEALAKFVEHERGVRVAPGLDENNSSLIERTKRNKRHLRKHYKVF